MSSFPSPPWSSFSLGFLTIHAYALCILAGILAALWLTASRWKARGGPEGSLGDLAIWAIPFGIIGGRFYHVITTPAPYFGTEGDFFRIFKIWEGGLGIWGAIALGVVGAWIGCRQVGVKLSTFLDAAAPGVLLAQGIGRWGNWFNQELFGRPTTLPWGLKIDATSPNFPHEYPVDTLFHPTFLYESLWSFLGVWFLLSLDRRFRFTGGRLFFLYVMWYTVGRSATEWLRIDPSEMIFGLRLNQWIGFFVFVGVFIVFLLRGKASESFSTPEVQTRPEKNVEPENNFKLELIESTMSGTVEGSEDSLPEESGEFSLDNISKKSSETDQQ